MGSRLFRGVGMKCKTCRFFEQRKQSMIEGSCHESPPTFYQANDNKACGFPPVKMDDWCGKWVLIRPYRKG